MVTSFLEMLMMTMRNKVLMNKGDISKIKLLWFYPSSMKPVRRNGLQSKWDELCIKHLPDTSPIGIPESLAPYYYYKNKNAVKGGVDRPAVSIDIGGGTTDVAIFKSQPLAITSFKFAANALFGDGYSPDGAANNHGMVIKYKAHFQKLLKANKLPELENILEKISVKNKSADINTYLLSLEENHIIKDKNLFSFNRLLSKDDDLKVIFLFFYAAMMYHLAQLMKAQGLDMPKNLLFSGTGSKLLSIISPNNVQLADLSKHIFSHVYEAEYDRDGLNLSTDYSQPKEITCKGGLVIPESDLSVDVGALRRVHQPVVGPDEKLTYAHLTSEFYDKAEKEVTDFIEFFLDDLSKKINFTDHFGVSATALDVFGQLARKNIKGYLMQGVDDNKRLDGITDDKKELEETLFFYPLVSILFDASNELSGLSPIQ